MDLKKIGKFICELRKSKGLTQKELAEKLFVTDKAVSKWERGLSFPDITTLRSLAEFFDVDISSILNGEKRIDRNIDLEKKIEEAMNKAKEKEEKKKKHRQKIKRVLMFLSLIVFILTLTLTLVYFGYLRRKGYHYSSELIFYIINQLLILSSILVFILFFSKLSYKKKLPFVFLAIIISIINIVFLFHQG